eukprot:g9770.t1
MWRAKKAGTSASAGGAGGRKGKGKAGAVAVVSAGSGAGVLTERAGNSSIAGNGVPGKKSTGLPSSSSSHFGDSGAAAAPKGERGRGRGPQRKPFQVDARRVREASERRVAPGTPIHTLKKRLKRTSEAQKPAPDPSATAAAAAAAAAATAAAAKGAAPAGAPGVTARAQAKAKAAAAARVRAGHVNGVSRSLDAARTKEVSDYLKSQISEANMLMEISGVDAARTLLADLLSCTDAARGVGELALYWAARAKLEEDAGDYRAARQLLDEGGAYISMPTQQKVMTKVMAAFEGRMNDREEVEVARLLEDSVGSMSLNDSATNSNSPASSAPFRYDPNDVSMGDDDDSGSPRSAIKNLNFSKIAREGDMIRSRDRDSESESGSAISTTTKNGSTTAFSPEGMQEAAAAGEGATSGGGVASMSGVIYSDDESDLSVVSDIDEGVIARAKAFAAEEEARKARMEAEAEGIEAEGAEGSRAAVDKDGGDYDNDDTENAPKEEEEQGNLDPARQGNEQHVSSHEADASPAAADVAPTSEPAALNARKKGSGSGSSSNNTTNTSSRGGASWSSSSSSAMAMAPPPPQPATMAMAGREPSKRKGTPHPKPHVKRTTPRRGKKADQDLSPGSFIAQVEATDKNGKRTLTPVRRSRRISSASIEATPAYLRKEMEAML